MNISIDNKRQGAITLATVAGSLFTLKPGVNENVPADVVKDNEGYLEALYKDGEITILSSELTAEPDAATFVPGDTVLDENGDPLLDDEGNVLVYDEEGNHVVQE